jgi:hypothetical protein
MKLMIRVGYGAIIGMEVTEDIGHVAKAMATAILYENNYGGTAPFKPMGTKELPERPTLQFVDEEQFVAPTPLVDSITAAAKSAESRWLEEYGKRTKAEKELAELKAKLAGINEEKKEAS